MKDINDHGFFLFFFYNCFIWFTGFTTSALYKELLANERTNFTLLQTAVSNLGGIPAMIHHSDMSNTIPDEKVKESEITSVF